MRGIVSLHPIPGTTLTSFVATKMFAPLAVVKVDDSNFQQEVLETDELVMVEFFAPWCGHCTKLKPEYEEASEKLRGVAKLVAVDATAATGLAQQFGAETPFETNKLSVCCANFLIENDHFPRHARDKQNKQLKKRVVFVF